MKFSNRASKYVDKLNRNNDYTCLDKEQVLNYFKRQSVPIFQKVIDFQVDYSGLELTVFKKPLSIFHARLFTAAEIRTNVAIDFLQINGRYYFNCGNHKTAQFWFGISQDGEICTLGDEEDSVNIIYSSFEKFIEAYAFENQLSENNKYEQPPYYNLLDKSAFDRLTLNCLFYTTANDNYNTWMSIDELIIHQGIWLDRTASYIHIYGNNKQQCNTYIQTLKDKDIVD